MRDFSISEYISAFLLRAELERGVENTKETEKLPRQRRTQSLAFLPRRGRRAHVSLTVRAGRAPLFLEGKTGKGWKPPGASRPYCSCARAGGGSEICVGCARGAMMDGTEPCGWVAYYTRELVVGCRFPSRPAPNRAVWGARAGKGSVAARYAVDHVTRAVAHAVGQALRARADGSVSSRARRNVAFQTGSGPSSCCWCPCW